MMSDKITPTIFAPIIMPIQISPLLTSKDIDNLQKGQRKMTSMLKEFDRICRKYDIKYWCVGGTLVGVLRHKGWVPWDADIDIGMLQTDYYKLKMCIQKELPANLWLQDAETDKNYHSDIAKIRDLYSCYIGYVDNYKNYEWHHGLQIDIFIFKLCDNGTYLEAVTNCKHDIDRQEYDLIFPLCDAVFEDVVVYIPNKYQLYSLKAWGSYPPPMPVINDRYPHEGLIDPDKCHKFMLDMYKNLYEERAKYQKIDMVNQ